MNIGYARVSSCSQSTDIQIEQLTGYGCSKIFAENKSAKDSNRGELKELLSFCRENDVIHVTKVDRIARNVIDALKIADQLKEKGTGIICHDLGNVDINSDIGRLIYTTISAFAEMERKRTLERCNQGRVKAKLEGRHLGRYKDIELHSKIYELSRQSVPKAKIAKELGCSRSTVYNALKGE